jgi:xylulose-5-phosphate/fructose-6-phosphate phosphoketolase
MPGERPAATAERLALVDANWRAACYLGAAQLYLRENALLRRPLTPEDIKDRLLGHWGTQPGLNILYAHLSRLIQDTSAEILNITGPGHGAPGILASLYLEGTLTEVYPKYSWDEHGLTQFVHDFSWPGGWPSHVTALTPGAINEGGELGYSLAHAFGAAFDNPDLLVACVIGDGESETGPLSASWQSNKFLDPAVDGAVLPILHLNGYKLSGPTLPARIPPAELASYLSGCGYESREVSGNVPATVHQDLWSALDWAYDRIVQIQTEARSGRGTRPPRWPALVLRTPKGWTCPKEIDGHALEGTFHAHQIPVQDPKTNPSHLKILEGWLRSYRPQELFDEQGRPSQAVTAIYPGPNKRMGRSSYANGGSRLKELRLPDYAGYGVTVSAPGGSDALGTEVLGTYLRDVFRLSATDRNFRLFCPDETSSNKLQNVFDATLRAFELPTIPTDEFLAPDGRVMEILSEHCCEGWLEGYLLTGRHGMFACYEAFISIVDSMMAQYAKWSKMAREIPWRVPVASLNYLLTSHIWEQDHNGYSHQGPTFINMLLTKKASMTRVYLPPDANCLLSVTDHALRSRGHINLIVASKKAIPQWLDPAAAREHCERGASIWDWASNDDGSPDVVMAAAGDVPTRETLAAVWWLRREVPDLRVRVVNVVDLLSLDSRDDHPHGMDETAFGELFTNETQVVFAFHGYPGVIHELIYRRPNPTRFHVRGYMEEGTTTTPFDMTVLNHMSRYDLAIAALQRTTRLRSKVADAIQTFQRKLVEHHAYIIANGRDSPQILEWRWDRAVPPDPGAAVTGPR